MIPQIYLSNLSNAIDKNIIKLLNYYDLEYKELRRNDKIVDTSCLFLNCDILDVQKFNDSFKEFILSNFSCIFFYNLSLQSSIVIELVAETKVILSKVKAGDFLYRVSDGDSDICKQLSGFSFTENESKEESIFKYKDPSIKSLITLNNEPFFIKLEKSNCEIFAVANNRVVDLEQKVTSEDFKISNIFSEFAPILMFLKYFSKDRFWHASDEYACFIIDDPLLKKRFGFLVFKKLLSLMDKYNFCSNIAFIPYNYNRSDNEVVHMFNEREDRFSISVHGCDHCEAEFGINDEKELNRKIKLAQSRMNKHKNLTEIEHNEIMVFPQGSFSSTSLKVLKANNFLSAINSNVIANNIHHLTISSFFSPVIMDYSNFPLFLRRYPEFVSDFALDLFMDRPIFFVEHHGFFKDDYKRLCKFVSKINKNFGKIKWRSPQHIIQNYYLERNMIKSKQVRIFANQVIIRNDSNKEILYRIFKQEDGTIPIEKILINEQKADYTYKNDLIYLKAVIQPNEKIEIRILYNNFFGISEKPGLVDDFKLLMRRLLTEVRDNYLSKNETLSKIASKAKYFIKKFVA